jgi:hypothetical protein
MSLVLRANGLVSSPDLVVISKELVDSGKLKFPSAESRLKREPRWTVRRD